MPTSFSDPTNTGDLSEAQERAVTSAAARLVVTGPPRSGKTTVLARRATHLVATGRVQPEEVVVFADTRDAVRQIRHQIQTTLPEEGESLVVSTVPDACATLLRQHGEVVGLDRFSIYPHAEARMLVGRVLNRLGYKRLSRSPREVWRTIAAVKARDERPGPVPASFPLDADGLQAVFEAYQDALRRARTLDVPDLMAHAGALLQQEKDLRMQYRSRWRHHLIDDAQNATPVTIAWLRQIRQTKDTHVVVTENPDLCVRFAFGATPNGADALLRDRAEVERIQLDTHHRLPAAVRRAAASVAQDTALWTDEANPGASGETGLVEAASGEDEARRIGESIARLQDVGACAYEETAVLAPTEALRESIRDHLTSIGIPVRVRGDVFGDEPALRDLLSYLRILANPHDDLHLLRVINEPSRGIGPKTKERIQSYAVEKEMSVWEAIPEAVASGDLSGRARRVLRGFRALMEPLVEQARNEAPATLARGVIEQTGYLQSVTRGHTREHLAREERIETLIRRLPSSEGGEVLHAFVHRAALGACRLDEDPAVTVSSIRAARGAAYLTVFVVGLEEGHLPREDAARREALLQEERRLLVAAMTRARHRCVLSWAQSRSGGSDDEPTTRSRFLDDLDSAAVTGRSALDPPTPEANEAASGPIQQSDPHYYRKNLRAQQANQRATPAPTDEQVNEIREGQRVEHPKMGAGTVQHTEGEGAKRIAVVEFDDVGTKKVKLKYAPLRELADDDA